MARFSIISLVVRGRQIKLGATDVAVSVCRTMVGRVRQATIPFRARVLPWASRLLCCSF